MKNYKFLLLLLISSVYNIGHAQYITVNETLTPQQLVENVLINNPCATVTNVTVSGGNYSSGELTYGSFSGLGTIFPFTQGIILSTGKVKNAPGPNNSLLRDGGDINWPGDLDLENALGLSNSINATIIEFDFIPLGNKISFDYLLSSEQYLLTASSNQCNFTDGFAFLLKEVGTSTYQNLAVVPNTTTPVKINTVRGNGSVCPPANEAYFDAFNEEEYPTNFNGQTKSMKAQANVIPGNQYHIKLVIADEGNYQYDSAIFLKAGSFNFGIDLGDDRVIANGNPICNSEAVTLDATSGGALSYQWFFNSTPLVGETNPTLTLNPPYNPVSQNGNYNVEITYSPTCTIPADITLEFIPDLITDVTTYTTCDLDNIQDGIHSFTNAEFNTIASTIYSNLPPNYNIQFFETTSSTTPITFPYRNTTANNQVVYAKITNINNCFAPVAITLTINTFNDILTEEKSALCDGSSITLTANASYASYTWNTIPAQVTPSITVSQPGTYVVTLENALGCFGTKTFTIVASEIATITNVETTDFLHNNTATVSVSGAGTYEYSLDGLNYQDSPYFSNLETGFYTVYVNDKNNCGEVTSEFYILSYPKFFTPNNDGFNDTWNIENLDKKGLENSKIYIFDRYGKLLKQISATKEGWNGKFNSQNLPSSDYWFLLELTNGKTIRGHFSLKR